MKRRTLIVSMCSMVLLACAEAQERPDEEELRFLRETGGELEIPRKGCVLIADCSSGLAPEAIDGAVRSLEGITRVDFKRKSLGAFEIATTPLKAKSEVGAAAAVFVVDCPALPLSLVAPEEFWGVVNVAPMRMGGANASVVARRAEKELLRIGALALGAWHGEGGSVLRGLKTANELDELQSGRLTLFELRNVMNSLLSLGVTRASTTTYLEACREGWAPPPTNDYQRAAWNRVKADKERGPTNPILIPPPNKKK